MAWIKWGALLLVWHVAAFVVFVVPHEITRGDHVDGFMRPLLLLGLTAYWIVYRQLVRATGPAHPVLVPWLLGFHMLFWAEMIMEAVVFTALDFHNTEANDPYFIAFWVLVATWLIGGWPWLMRRQKGARD